MSVISERRLSDKEAGSIDELLKSMFNDYSPEDITTVKRAYDFSEEAHRGQIRRSGEAYVSHPLGVASYIS